MSKEKVIRKPVEKIKPGQIVLFVVTILLAILFLYPVFFALISAFKSNGDILKNPIALPTSFYTQNFKDLFAQSDFATAILHSVFLTVVSEVLIVCIVPMAAYGIERRKSKTTSPDLHLFPGRNDDSFSSVHVPSVQGDEGFPYLR